MSPPHQRDYHAITTARLLIRSIQPQDDEAVFTLRTNPANFAYLNMEPGLTLDTIRARHRQWIEEMREGKRAKMEVILQEGRPSDNDAEGPLIGVSGVNRFLMMPDVDVTSRQAFTADIGVIIDSNYAGKGYGYEAMKAVIEYCFDEMKAEQIFIETRVKNTGMMNILRKLGVNQAGKVIPLKINGMDGFDVLFSKRTWDEAQNLQARHSA